MSLLAGLVGLAAVFGLLFSLIYYWATCTYGFWRLRGVAGPKPTALWGNDKAVFDEEMSFGEWLADNYKNYPDVPIIGVFMGRKPVAIIRDHDLMKDVLIKAFSEFPDRGIETFEKAKPLSQHMLNLDYQKWKPLRSKFSHAFTSSKLKEMFHSLWECGDIFQKYLDKRVALNDTIECHDLASCFMTDAICMCAFGVETKTMADEESEFKNMGKYITDMDWKKRVMFRIKKYAPWLFRLLAFVVHDSAATEFFLKAMKDAIDSKRRNGGRDDVIHQMMEIQDNHDKFDFEITDNLLAAQMFGFFFGAFQTSSATMSNALYELAQHQDCQNKLRDEICRVLQPNEDALTYQQRVNSMMYLDKVFKETLRKYPVAMRLVRRSQVEYTFACGVLGEVTIPKNTLVYISVLGMHRDPKIYPNPDLFDPERFTKEAVAARPSMSYLPFGDGPRRCIGKKMAIDQVKVGICKLLQRYRVEISDRTEIPYTTNPRSGVLHASLNGIYLRFSKI